MKQGGKRGMKTALRDVPLGMDAAFPKAEFDGRIRALRRAMADQRIELYLTHGPENIFYLTGQQTMGHYPAQCLGVPLKGAPFLLTRNVEIFNARANTYLANIVPYFDEADPAVRFRRELEEGGAAPQG